MNLSEKVKTFATSEKDGGGEGISNAESYTVSSVNLESNFKVEA